LEDYAEFAMEERKSQAAVVAESMSNEKRQVRAIVDNLP